MNELLGIGTFHRGPSINVRTFLHRYTPFLKSTDLIADTSFYYPDTRLFLIIPEHHPGGGIWVFLKHGLGYYYLILHSTFYSP